MIIARFQWEGVDWTIKASEDENGIVNIIVDNAVNHKTGDKLNIQDSLFVMSGSPQQFYVRALKSYIRRRDKA
jgi:hypothetical protein